MRSSARRTRQRCRQLVTRANGHGSSALMQSLLVLSLAGCPDPDELEDAAANSGSNSDAAVTDAGDACSDAGASRCLQEHLVRPDNMDPAARLAEEQCAADSGDCQSSTMCVGSVNDRICGATRFISREAALCIAMSRQLAPGLSALMAQLGYHYGYRRVLWHVSNTSCDSDLDSGVDCPSGNQGGQVMGIDAVTGEVYDTLGWLTIRN